jgi:hypothetical protein
MSAESDQVLSVVKQMFNLTPGMGLGTPAWDPYAGLEQQRRRRAAQGASADERIKALTDAGVTDRAGMAAVAERLYTSPERAFMLAKGRK